MNVLLFEQHIPRFILDGIQVVHKAVFDGDSLREEKLNDKNNLLAVVVLIDNAVVGFKLGYEHPDGVFYSWLGGVHPHFQKQGIAAACMVAQHDWCREKGYNCVRTYGRNAKKAMLIVNLKAGFDIVSTFVDHKGRHKIVFEKLL